MITNFHATARSHLVLPLSRHDLRVETSNLNTRCQALCNVVLSNWTANCCAGARTCVVWALRTRLTAIIIEAKRLSWLHSNLARLHECVLLLNAIPWIELFVLLVQLCAR